MRNGLNRRAATAAQSILAALALLIAVVGVRQTAFAGGQGASGCDPQRDREAILGMTGTFHVSFHFEEVPPALAPGYILRPPFDTEGIEVVMAIENTPKRLSLQHILLIDIGEGEFFPLKHWRQDWNFEDQHLFEFQGNRIWQHRDIDKQEIRCTWSQAVSQVDDGPRYESYGYWVHNPENSVWTSQLTNRPLPQRELRVRNDYDLLLAVNKHVVDANGWSHEEDNLKWVLSSQSALVREIGLNRYDRIDLDAETVAFDYFNRTGAFWSDVRSEWDRLLGKSGSVLVLDRINGVASFDILFPLADELADANPHQRRTQIHEILDAYVEP
jgi:hypothetical protein